MPSVAASVQRILERVEALPAMACGAFVVERDRCEVCMVFVESNRVCWAGADTLRARLRELLSSSARAVTKDARDLLMRAAIERHTIESLVALPQDQGERVTWIDRETSMQPRFSFAPADLFAGVNAYLYRAGLDDSDFIRIDHHDTVGGASFVTGEDGDLIPVRVHGAVGSIAQLTALATWAGAAFEVTRGFSAEVLRRAAATATGKHVALAWRTARTRTHVAVIANGAPLERYVARLSTQGFPAVVSNRVASFVHEPSLTSHNP